MDNNQTSGGGAPARMFRARPNLCTSGQVARCGASRDRAEQQECAFYFPSGGGWCGHLLWGDRCNNANAREDARAKA